MSEHAHRCKSNASEALWKLRSSAILDEGKYHPVHESGISEVEKILSEIISGHGTTDWFHTGKGVCQGYILSPCLLNFYAEYIMRNAGLEETQAGIKIAGSPCCTRDSQESFLASQFKSIDSSNP